MLQNLKLTTADIAEQIYNTPCTNNKRTIKDHSEKGSNKTNVPAKHLEILMLI